jgi:hypothetical protein
LFNFQTHDCHRSSSEHSADGPTQLIVDGTLQPGSAIDLVDDHRHHAVELRIPGRSDNSRFANVSSD